MSLFIFIPSFNAQDNYYDYEVIELDSLPTASEETVNKLYKVNDKYYLGEVITGGYTPLPLNENLNGKRIYVKDISYMIDNSDYDYLKGKSVLMTESYYDNGDYDKEYFNFYYQDTSIIVSALCDIKTLGSNSFVFRKPNNSYDITYFPFFDIDKSCSIKYWFNSNLFDFSQFFSLTPFETTYSFKEIDKSLVVPPVKDFYLFYKFEDIQEFKVLSVFDLSTFTDFEKLVVTLLFNILFLGFLGFCCYILLKFIYKGISMLFR